MISGSSPLPASARRVDLVPGLESFRWAVESVVRADLGWTSFGPDVREVLLQGNTYVHAATGLTSGDATIVNAHLKTVAGYLGMREVVESDPWHVQLYIQGLPAAFCVQPRQLWLVAEPHEDVEDAGREIEWGEIFPSVTVRRLGLDR
jgi:hypothetical protein